MMGGSIILTSSVEFQGDSPRSVVRSDKTIRCFVRGWTTNLRTDIFAQIYRALSRPRLRRLTSSLRFIARIVSAFRWDAWENEEEIAKGGFVPGVGRLGSSQASNCWFMAEGRKSNLNSSQRDENHENSNFFY